MFRFLDKCNTPEPNIGNIVSLQKYFRMENTAPVSFTDSSRNELTRLIQQDGFDKSQKLRIGVKGGGCSGMSYVLGFDLPMEHDEVFEINGISCIMNKSHLMYLHGMQIEWKNDLNARGFVFTNPNASKTCGCGTSFAV